MEGKPTLYVCHGDESGPNMHPCRRVQKALKGAGLEYEKVIAAKGSPWPWRREHPRPKLREATGSEKLPALKLADGSVLTGSRAILSWVRAQG